MIETIDTIVLPARQRWVVEGVAQGRTLRAIARGRGIGEETAVRYFRTARRMLRESSQPHTAVAVAYTYQAILRPDVHDLGVGVPHGERILMPLIAQGLPTSQMADRVKWPAKTVVRLVYDLETRMGARNRAHLITLAWQAGLLTASQMRAWFDQVDARALARTVLAWGKTSARPRAEDVVGAVPRLSRYAYRFAAEVREQCLAVPFGTGSAACAQALDVLEEADRLLVPGPPGRQATVEQARALARLVFRLVRASERLAPDLAGLPDLRGLR
ncbi:DUF6415 family natural product biosynthesis protein [Streptomyces buecherae]|uniref:DUF6415 family natural product biosynthesis protein n=1 Tax=Streptomyces buecherae TaxID=2763006 RepID=UPI001C255881|nr:DUF6415 family natural product biosynthesis protein [Streptomyces buecherae]